MTVDVCFRMGVNMTPTSVSKDDSGNGASLSSSFDTSEAPSRPKFMITDILAGQNSPVTSTSQDIGSADPSEEPKDLRMVRQGSDDEEIDLEGEISNDEDDADVSENKEIDGSKENSGPPPCKKQRKARTAFSDQQLQTLEKSFERQKYLSVQDRMELAAKLNLTDTQVKTWYQNRRTKWKRQTAVGLELLAEAGNYAAVQRLYGSNTYGWPYPPQPGAAAAAAAVSSVDLYYRQAAAAAALQKPLAYRLYPPALPLLPTALGADPLRDGLRPELRLNSLRPEVIRPEALRSLVSTALSPTLSGPSLAVKSVIASTPLTSPLASSPLSTSTSPLPQTMASFYRSETASLV